MLRIYKDSLDHSNLEIYVNLTKKIVLWIEYTRNISSNFILTLTLQNGITTTISSYASHNLHSECESESINSLFRLRFGASHHKRPHRSNHNAHIWKFPSYNICAYRQYVHQMNQIEYAPRQSYCLTSDQINFATYVYKQYAAHSKLAEQISVCHRRYTQDTMLICCETWANPGQPNWCILRHSWRRPPELRQCHLRWLVGLDTSMCINSCSCWSDRYGNLK